MPLRADQISESGELIEEIQRAFRDVERGKGVSLHETKVIDAYGSEDERLRTAANPSLLRTATGVAIFWSGESVGPRLSVSSFVRRKTMRTLLLMPDWNTSLCWHDAEGCGVADERTLPLSDELRKHLDDYYAWWSNLFLAEDPGPVSCIDWHLVDERGFQLWQRLRAELGNIYHVHFYSHEFKETFQDPEQFTKICTK
jgi:hypothetical protein